MGAVFGDSRLPISSGVYRLFIIDFLVGELIRGVAVLLVVAGVGPRKIDYYSIFIFQK
jgi:hypothetical protein